MMEEIGGGGKLGGEVCVSRSVEEVWKGMMNWLGFVMKFFLQILRGTPSMAQFLLSYIGFTFPLLSSSSSLSFKPLPVVEIPLQETTSNKITETTHDSSCPPGYVCDSGASDDCPIEKLTVVLDLDETLICAYETSSLPAIIRTQAVEAGVKCFELECYSSDKDAEGKARINYVTVFERPGLKEFLKQIGEFADLILFTAGLEGYARPLFDRIDVENRFSQCLYRPSTVSTEYREHVKDLSCLSKDPDFYIIDMDDDCALNSTHILLGRPFMKTARTKIDVHKGTLSFEFDGEIVTFNIFDAMKYPDEFESVFHIDVIDPIVQDDFELNLMKDKLNLVLQQSKTDKDARREIDEDMKEAIMSLHSLPIMPNMWTSLPVELPSSHVKDLPSIVKPPKLELKMLPTHLKYVYLGEDETLPVIIANDLTEVHEEKLLRVLREHKTAIGWTLADIKGISPTLCMHRIFLNDDAKPVREPQRKLNPAMKEVVMKEILKLLDQGIIYPISDSPWVSPVHVVPKKTGLTLVPNEQNELIPMRVQNGWRMCIDFRKLNAHTRKDHFPIPFIDEMLERLAGKSFFCFLDGFSGYYQIIVAQEDQEKTTFTCPFGTFAYRRIVDNSPFSFLLQPLNGIPCVPFSARLPYDEQLLDVVLPLIKNLSLQKDVRPVLYERFHMPEWFQMHGIPASALTV